MNIIPTKVLSGVFPLEKLFGQKLDDHLVRVFGCLSYPLLYPYNRHKLQYRSTPCTFLGYAPIHKGYKCVDQTGRVFISRHVWFDESIILFAKASTLSSTPVLDSSSSVTTLSVLMIPSTINMPSILPMSGASDSITLSPQSSTTSTHSDILSLQALDSTILVEHIVIPWTHSYDLQVQINKSLVLVTFTP